MELPGTFVDKMKNLLGDEFQEYIACYDEPRYYGLRVNTAKISPERFQEICPFEIRPIPWIRNGFYYDGEQVTPSKHPYYFAGLYYLQEPSAMTPADRLPVEPGDRVLDVCAAPGGKATELGARLGGRGVLAANDLSSSRAKGLLKNIEVFGIGNALVLSEEPGKLADRFPEYFDKILIDAPCSGEGMFRKDRRMVKAWEEHGPEYFCGIQKGIILQAARMLRPGGMMLYSTCTFDGRENEQVIEHLLAYCPEFTIVPMKGYEGFCAGKPECTKTADERLKDTVRIFPHRMKGEGHYLALLKKGEPTGGEYPGGRDRARGQAEPDRLAAAAGRVGNVGNVGNVENARKSAANVGKRRIPEELGGFLGEMPGRFDTDRLDIRGERVYYMPEGLPDMRGIRFLRTGLLLGELKKNRFEPSQALAMNLRKEEYAKTIDLSAKDARTAKYLKGETLEVGDLVGPEEKGWYLVCVDSYPLGWGKLSGGVLKNKYLPGWRLMHA